MDKTKPIFDQRKIYEEEIMPHISEIKKICALNHFPCFTCVAVANNGKETTYKYDGVLPGYLNMNLANDHFSRHLCVANGFEVKPPGVVDNFESVEDFLSENPIEDSSITEIPPELLDS